MRGLRSERFDHISGLFPLKFGESKTSPLVVKELKFRSRSRLKKLGV
jgi:hypothetical protein